jgi:transcriptional regulator with XRE-family HTH domain
MSIGKRIKQRRDMLRLSQEDLAREVGISQEMISKVEKGLAQTTRSLPLIAHVLKVNALWLQTGEGVPDLDYSPTFEDSNPIIKELTKLIKSTDKRGQEKILLAAKDALDLHNAMKDSLKNFDAAHLVDAVVEQLTQKTRSEVIDSETTSDDHIYDENAHQVHKRH